MTTRIAIHQDVIHHRNGEVQSFSQRWTELAELHGIGVKKVDSRSDDFLETLLGCSGLMWRFGYGLSEITHARRLLQAVEHGMKMPVFPNMRTAWHFEDKISQQYLLRSAGLPTPKTELFFRKDEAMNFCDEAVYPFVAKLTNGIQSRNVVLVKDRLQAIELVSKLFGAGVISFEPTSPLARLLGRSLIPIKLMMGRFLPSELQSGYLYAQAFLPDNDFDTRVTVIGNRAYAFRRFNRPGDFRASGSGRIDWDPEKIDLDFITLAFKVADLLRTQSVAIDGLRSDGAPVIGEISYTYASWAVRDCPGHWRRTDTDVLSWVPGKLAPEDAIFEDFLAELSAA